MHDRLRGGGGEFIDDPNVYSWIVMHLFETAGTDRKSRLEFTGCVA